MNSCMWATVHSSKDEDDVKRIIQNMEVQKIQTVFETVQAQISDLRLRDQEICGLSEHVDWTVTGGSIRCLTHELLINSRRKYTYLVIQFCASLENVTIILKQQQFGKRIESFILLKNVEYRPLYDLTGEPVEFMWMIDVGLNINVNSRVRQEDAGRGSRSTVPIPGQDHLHVSVQ